jgi:N-acetylglucosaminyltransferase
MRSFAVPAAVTDFVDVALPAVFAAYLAAVASYLTLQVVFAERTRRRGSARPLVAQTPPVDIIIPCYNEDPAILAACLESVSRQDYEGSVSVHVVDDGSPNRATLDPVYAEYEGREGFRILKLETNRGKRFAQAEVITSSQGDIVIAIDSDTTIAPDGVRNMVAALDDPQVGAAMGEMLAANADTNWLTRLIDLRYWYACNQERAAQSEFGAVLCCSGPFSAYRRSVLEKVLDDYLNQTFLGRLTTYGEDRHLTNLVLRCGSRTTYVPTAKARTTAPDRMRPFLRQQLRWNRCTYRDTLAIVGQLPQFGAYLVFDAVMQVFAPALLGLTVLLLGLHLLGAGAAGLGWYAGGLALVALGYCGYGTWRCKKTSFLTFALYGVLHVALLIPARLQALATITDDRWGRRGVSA